MERVRPCDERRKEYPLHYPSYASPYDQHTAIGRVRVTGYGSIMESIMETDYGSIIDRMAIINHNRITGSRVSYANYEVNYGSCFPYITSHCSK